MQVAGQAFRGFGLIREIITRILTKQEMVAFVLIPTKIISAEAFQTLSLKVRNTSLFHQQASCRN